jgi:hypothetical protein
MTKKLFFILPIIFLFFLSAKEALAQSFSFTPQTATQSAGVGFTVAVKIDVGINKTIGADLKITYDPTLIQVADVQRGDFFSKGGFNSTSGLLYLSYGIDSGGAAKTGSGAYATLTFKGEKAGEALITVVCSNQSTDSNVWDEASKDIIVCPAIKNPSYTFTGSVSVIPTPTLSVGIGGAVASSSGLTATPAPPVSGIIGPTFLSLGLGILLLVIGLAFLF